MLVVVFGALWGASLIAGSATTSSIVTLAPSAKATPPLAALPEELSFTADGGVWLVHRDGTQQRLVGPFDAPPGQVVFRRLRSFGGVEWSPDGSTLLAFRQGASPALVLVDASGEIGPVVAAGASLGRWSPDGTRIAFVRGERGAADALFVVSSEGRRATRVATHGQYGRGTFSWSPDGTSIVYAGQGETGLFVADARGRGAPRRIRIGPGESRGVGEVQWSPDGSLIAFTSGGHVYVVRPDGTGSRRVADGYWYAIAWSPDSQQIAFQGPAGPRTYGNVTVVGRDGSSLHRVAGCPCSRRGAGFSPSLSWSSDGTRIAYVGGSGNQVSTVRPDGTGAGAPVATEQYPWWPLWRPVVRR